MPEKFIADLHIHSHFSIATSKNLIPEHLDRWARLKGITILGTGDCVHPGWLKELKEKLEPADNGLYRLREAFRSDANYNGKMPENVYFLLTGEISNIYKKNGKVRKVHNLCVFPDFEAAEKIQARLGRKFNIESDGRPILGLDSKILLEMVLGSSGKSYLIPAHIWTPWFSVLGSKSGFDDISECYEDLTKHIFAVETGLSSDPAMNRTCSFLNGYKLVSNSDAHSPEKVGREANMFDCELSYDGVYNALSGNEGFLGTIEFFPQEGKYHYDGHRKCGISWDPLETLRHNGICSVCNKPVTKGVMYRVAELADSGNDNNKNDGTCFYSVTSLPDLLAELMNKKNSSSKQVQQEYFSLLERLGPEFHILMSAGLNEIKETGGEMLSEGIKRLREGNVNIKEGYDGEFGRITVFSKEELGNFSGISLFRQSEDENGGGAAKEKSSIRFDIKEFQALKSSRPGNEPTAETSLITGFSADQSDAINHFEGPCMVIAGPGSGKTRVLTERIINLIDNNINPENILAVTFSNKAAGEMRERVQKADMSGKASRATISTFHSFGLSVLKKYYGNFERPEHFYIIDFPEKFELIKDLTGGNARQINKIINGIEKYKQGVSVSISKKDADADLSDPTDLSDSDLSDLNLLYLNTTDLNLIEKYNKELKIRGAFDIDDLICLPVELFKASEEILSEYSARYRWILIDEYQDINSRQYELIMLIAGGDNPNLFVIGDPDQSIYGFRGSDTRFIEKLNTRFPGIKIINLSSSYRCPSAIMKAGSQILGKSESITGRSENIKIQIQRTETGNSEADWIAEKIESMIGGVRSFSMDSGISDGSADEEGIGFSDFAVLCRAAFMFDPLIKAFIDHGIAYQVVGTEPFYNKDPFNMLISRFKRTYYHMVNVEGTALNILKDNIREMIRDRAAISEILSCMMRDTEINNEDRKRLEAFSAYFGNDYEKFFLNLSTRQGIDEYNDNAEAVSILTMHASKGLEFNTVFIPGCEQGIIPFELFGRKNKNELEEEERLFYVGITRTKKNLFLTHASKRLYKGRVLMQQKSPLLDRLEKGLLKFGTREKKQSINDNKQLNLFE